MKCTKCGYPYSKDVLCGKCVAYPDGYVFNRERFVREEEPRTSYSTTGVEHEHEHEHEHEDEEIYLHPPVTLYTTTCVVCGDATRTTKPYRRYRCGQCRKKGAIMSCALWQLNHPLSEMEAMRKKVMTELELEIHR